jgi:hypothetical protein
MAVTVVSYALAYTLLFMHQWWQITPRLRNQTDACFPMGSGVCFLSFIRRRQLLQGKTRQISWRPITHELREMKVCSAANGWAIR